MAKAIGYIVHQFMDYPDDVASYKPVKTRADVAAELVDLGWLENPAIWVYKLTKGETAADRIADLASGPDPYPDFIVIRGARGGVYWMKA